MAQRLLLLCPLWQENSEKKVSMEKSGISYSLYNCGFRFSLLECRDMFNITLSKVKWLLIANLKQCVELSV